MSTRDAVLARVRRALGRNAGAPPAGPPVRLAQPVVDVETRVAMFCSALGKLAGRPYVAASQNDAREYVAKILEGKRGIASNAAVLRDIGITSLPDVTSGVTDKAALRELCAQSGVGLTGADYALADTGSMVMLSSAEEARMISLLPPVHVAIVRRERLLSGLDELLTLLPQPAEQTSSMVLITGTSRTADIEQILVRGVHGPGEVHAVVV